MRLDFVILPSEEVKIQLTEAIARIQKKYKLVFAVDNKRLFSHVTLFHLEIANKNLGKVTQIFEHLTEEQKEFKLELTQIESSGNYFGIGIKKKSELLKLHKKVVLGLFNYKTNAVWKSQTDWNPEEIKNFKKYGSRQILKLYRPHFTLGYVKDLMDISRIKKDLKAVKISNFVAEAFAVTEIDPKGQVTCVIERVDELGQAIKVLESGGTVIYPTDTAYGIAVDATNDQAVNKLYRLKGRGFNKPIHIIPPTIESIESFVAVSAPAKKLMDKFLPGPITLVLPLTAKGRAWQLLSAGTKSIGIRLPDNKIALALVKEFGKPITTTSANVSGEPNCYSIAQVKKQFAKSKLKPDFYLDGGNLPKLEPSTVVSLIKGVKILRAGPISEMQIKKALK